MGKFCGKIQLSIIIQANPGHPCQLPCPQKLFLETYFCKNLSIVQKKKSKFSHNDFQRKDPALCKNRYILTDELSASDKDAMLASTCFLISMSFSVDFQGKK